MPLAKDEVGRALSELRQNLVKRKFSQSIELVVKLREVDLKKPENRINEAIPLPNPPESPVKICVIASGDLGTRAKNAGADILVTRDQIDSLNKDKKSARKLAQDYDFFIAEAPMMPQVGRALGSFLGPRGKMPTPVPPNAPIDQIISGHRKMVRVRMREQQVLSCRIGTESMSDDKLAENIQTVISRIEEKLERGFKNISEILVKATMSKPVKIGITK
ncbi:MAG TPA: 50S ribosomal protein L1 [Candidatus Saccharimonadales bacterium]|nr:50S ribosomal protein L1 [Candidatus Saccharimonadales bacterium]